MSKFSGGRYSDAVAPNFNPARFSLARRRRGLTKTALAEKVGVSTRMIAGYESGEHEPHDRTATKLADVLKFPMEFFYRPDLDEPPIDACSFRSLTTLHARQRDQAIGAGALALALSDWIDARFTLPEPNIPQYRVVDPETAAMAVRSEWGLGERPVRNMIHLLEAHGIRVFSLTEECRALDAFSFWRGGHLPYAFLNTMKSAERSRMDAAHELGHLALHRKETAHGRDLEREADLFASAFLMPRGSVLAEAPRGGRLDQLIQAKLRWNVSVAGLVYRMHRLGLLSDWQYHSLFVEIGRKSYRTNEPNGSQPETSQVLTKVFKTMREEGQTMSDIAGELAITSEELSNLIFGLVLTPLEGLGNRGSSQGKSSLRLV